MRSLFNVLRHHRAVRMFAKRSGLLRATASKFEAKPDAGERQGGRPVRRVIAVDPARSFEIFQANYFDSLRWRYKAGVTLVNPHGSLLFSINTDGLKGEEIDPSKRLGVFWGDSVVWGAGRGWVHGLDEMFPGWQFLNGGIEGAPLDVICEHALEKNADLGIHRNVLFPGWHSMRWPRRVRRLLDAAVRRIPGPVLLTVPTSLGNELSKTDLTSLISSRVEPSFNQNDDDARNFLDGQYYFWAGLPYSVKNARMLLSRVKAQNAVVREVARRRDVPLIDLYESFYVDDVKRFRDVFFDAGHFRVRSYPNVQRIVAEELRRAL